MLTLVGYAILATAVQTAAPYLYNLDMPRVAQEPTDSLAQQTALTLSAFDTGRMSELSSLYPKDPPKTIQEVWKHCAVIVPISRENVPVEAADVYHSRVVLRGHPWNHPDRTVTCTFWLGWEHAYAGSYWGLGY